MKKRKLLFKICGLRSPENIINIDLLKPDFLGFIFYDKSPRYVSESLPETITPKVGVFVNETKEFIEDKINKHGLSIIQLHGNESPELCRYFKKRYQVFKAFSVSGPGDFMKCKEYEGCCSFFLFDTKTVMYGGSGKKFDWSLLKEYNLNTPFLLSGGIKNEDFDNIIKIDHKMFAGIDINSGFEIKPALKNIELIKDFKNKLDYYEQNR